jgi:hypothetical protein
VVTRRPFTARTQQYARARVSANMTSTVTIVRMTAPALDLDTLYVATANREVVYQGKARVHRVTGAGVTMIGEMDLDTRAVTVDIPWDAPKPRQDDVVLIGTTTDASLAGRPFQVRDVSTGGLLNTHLELSCTGFAESRAWVAS